MKKTISRSLTALCTGVLLYALVALGFIGYDYLNNRHVLAEAQKLYTVEREIPGEEVYTETLSGEEAFVGLHEINEDIAGWLTIDGTAIDYPIMQAEDNDFYLDRNYKKEQTRAGSLFFDYRNELDGTDRNVIVYGHRMKDGSMFAPLTDFLDDSFFESDSDILFDTVDGKYTVEVFSVYNTMTDFYYIETEFKDDHDFTEFVGELKSRSHFKSDVDVTAADQIITLSTCDYVLDPSEGRLVVHGKIVERR
ncbi:class B sortase [Geomicrobium sp. JCM 19039]|uniref:class B sortase n=1 Tax=Geomicrobium sp. JCM 19039 TaxID=1460636 RepID=UPI00045F2A4F|nr:class B sortase [Geomicrobium sp. JCM 19039]GAK11509.1 NPQTN specific sortase B [Geomicrobium sp. JCM 19039]